MIKPVFVRWYMCILLPFLHIDFVMVGFIIGNFIQQNIEAVGEKRDRVVVRKAISAAEAVEVAFLL